MAKQKFACWDEVNLTEEEATRIDAYDSISAAEEYARQDVDGNTDGVYFSNEQPILVRHESGRLERFMVSAEATPVYSAKRAPEQPKQEGSGW